MDLSRRHLLGAAGAAGAVGAASAARLLSDGTTSSFRPVSYAPLPHPGESGIEHIVVVMMENRSFDHMFGWLPSAGLDADGRQAGLNYRDRYGVVHGTHHLEMTASCGFHDPDHSYEGGRIQLNGGKCDGFLRSGENDLLAIGYYTQDDLDFFGHAAPEFTTFDRYFSAVMAETYPNRFYMHAAQTDRLHNNTDQSKLTTIWDRLNDKGVSHGYYFGDLAFTLLWYGKYSDISHPSQQFFVDAAAGTLPAVSYLDPRFEDEASGTSNDDHPHADIRAGQDFLNQVYDSVRNSPNWDKTLLVINYDEWGGFFDHVAPTRTADVSSKTALRGFRTPALMISPFARRGHVAHRTYDHSSILRMIEWRHGLKPLTPRDKNARNIAEVLDFGNPKLDTPTYTVAPAVITPCTDDPPSGVGVSSEEAEWSELRELGEQLGWGVVA